MKSRAGNIFSMLCLACAGVQPAVSAAAEYQALPGIYWVAKQFMQKHVAAEGTADAIITPGKLDSRLKLNRCDKSLKAYLPKGSRSIGNTTVGVKCTGTRPWSINLPVKVDVFRNVLVSTRQLSRGDIVAAGDIKLASRNLADLAYGYLDDYDACLGMNVKRRVLPGTALTPAMLNKPQRVKRGQRVTILADNGRMQVRMAGKALGSGAVGDRIQVQNVSSSRKLEGVITDNGEVQVDL